MKNKFCDHKLIFFIAETCKFERLSIENFKKHSVLMMVALQDLTLHCGKDLEGEYSLLNDPVLFAC